MNSNIDDDSAPGVSFFAVSLSSDTSISNPEKFVFRDKAEAMRLVKLHKVARFKAFATFKDAVKFVLSPKKSSAPASSGSSTPSEKPSHYSAPKHLELVRLRTAMDKGNLNYVMTAIDENPRHLISSGDTPSIFQEGARYNALHLVAKAGHAEIASYLLTTVSSPHFVRKLYGLSEDTDQETLKMRCSIFLDLYLNTPDKSCNETPVHFASKFGSLEVIRVFVSYPQCLKITKNKFGKTPIQLACTRHVDGPESDLAKSIKTLLSEQYYVPVMSSEDPTVQPVVGDLFTPEKPPILEQKHKISPTMSVRAVAGPMTERKATNFRKLWKGSPRGTNRLPASPAQTSLVKGLEKIGRQIAKEQDVPWKEYWPFLDAFVDIRSAEGLAMLESYLKSRYDSLVPSCQESVDSPGALELSYIQTKHSPLSESSPIQQLCKSLSALTLESPVRKENAVTYSQMEACCEVYAKRICESISRGVAQYKMEIKHLQSFLKSCSSDPRFGNIALMKSHSRIPFLIAHRLSSYSDSSMKGINSILRELEYDLQLDGPEGNLPAELCIISKTKDAFLLANNNPSTDILSCWDQLDICTCQCPINPCPSRKLSYFSPRRSYSYKQPLPAKCLPALSNISLSKLADCSDSSDTDEFLTPPTSPTMDRSSEDEDFVMPDRALVPDIFITGSQPTFQDVEVFDAIESASLSPETHPFIYYWKHQCITYKRYRPDSWLLLGNHKTSSPPHSVSSKDEECLTPSWNRSPACSPLYRNISSVLQPKQL